MSIYRIILIAFLMLSVLIQEAATQSTSSTSTQAEPKPAPERLAADILRATSGGTTFTVPTGWAITTGKNLIVLEPPETDLHIALFDSQSTDAKAAVAAAWAAYKPDNKRPIRMINPQPAHDGWDEYQAFTYETSPNERAVVLVWAMRAGSNWTVAILDGSSMTFEKRVAPVSLVLDGLRPKNYKPESFAGHTAHPLDAARIAQLKRFVANSMRTLGIPGASMALIDGGKIVYEGGFGVRELGKPEPVDENTLFMPASNTKAMTTLLLSVLVDEKKLRWDEPVTEAYPNFKLGDADTTKRVLIKHLVCACTGLPRQDMELIFGFKHQTPESLMVLLGTMQPTSKFGEVFQYSNLMAVAAGFVAAHVLYPNKELGAAYVQAMQHKIFDSLGMKSTTFDMARALRGNHASPHGDDLDGKPTVADIALDYSVVPDLPDGGMWTSAHDLIRYVQLELAQGTLPNGKQLVSAENLLARRKPQIFAGGDESYGMGLAVSRQYDITLVHHGGSLAGYKSDFYFLPDSGIGAVLLTNSDNGVALLGPFQQRLLEILFDAKAEAEADVASAVANHKANVAKRRELLKSPAEASLVAQLAPRYHSKELGGLEVIRKDGVTTFDFGEWKSAVASRKNDDGTISFVTIDPTLGGYQFVVGERSGKKVLILRDGQHEYLFIQATVSTD